jgi:hypothetical protein
MKARNVLVSVSDFGNEVFVNVTLRLPGRTLGKETPLPNFSRVSEHDRKRVAKELQRVLEAVEFPDK